jgi:DNA-binding response OmpR family regulator
MSRVLVIEDRPQRRASGALAREGFTVFTALGVDEAIQSVDSLQPAMVLFEVTSPTHRVLQTCELIRAGYSHTPIIVLSGQCKERDAVAAFTAGADSVVCEPVGQHELIARVRALLRRAPVTRDREGDVLVVGPISLDRGRREVLVNGTVVALPRREFEIAEVLMREAGRVVPRAAIVRELWGSMRDTKSLDVQVGRLRSRLAAAGGGRCIVTVRGVGFRFATSNELAPQIRRAEIDLRNLETAAAGAMRFDIDLVDEMTEFEEPAQR